jgi:hypothetical protein
VSFGVLPISDWESLGGWVADSDKRSLRFTQLLQAFHGRHVPLTPRLAEALLELEVLKYPTDQRLWGRSFALAAEALAAPGLFGRSVLWSRIQELFHLRVAEPVIRAATAKVGRVLVLGRERLFPPEAEILSGSLAAYVGELEAEVEKLLSDLEGMGLQFWTQVAVELLDAADRATTGSHTQFAQSSQGTRTRIPVVADRILTGLLFGVEPRFEPGALEWLRHMRPRHISLRDRSGIRPKQGGVVGVVPSRRLEDMQDALVSELMWPVELLVQRVDEGGMLVRHRPPMRKPKRDVLGLTLVHEPQMTDALRTVKSAWCDAALRASTKLAELGMPRSHLVWSETNPYGVRGSVLCVESLSGAQRDMALGLNQGFSLSQAQRAVQFFQSGLLPGILDEVPATLLESNEKPLKAALTEALDAIVRPVLRLGVGPTGLQSPRQRANTADYRKVVVTTFVGHDAAGSTQSLAMQRQESRAEVRSNGSVEVVAHVVQLPKRIERGASFTISSDLPALEGTVVEVADGSSSEDALARSLGRLIDKLLYMVIGAVADDG